jgi:hypothetical protein
MPVRRLSPLFGLRGRARFSTLALPCAGAPNSSCHCATAQVGLTRRLGSRCPAIGFPGAPMSCPAPYKAQADVAPDTDRRAAVHPRGRRKERVGGPLAHRRVENELAGRDLPVGTDSSTTSGRYVSGLRKAAFDPIEAFFALEGKRYGVSLPDPVEVYLAPAISSPPPVAPFGGNPLSIAFWSLQLRAWAWWNDSHKGPKPDVRSFRRVPRSGREPAAPAFDRPAEGPDWRGQRLCGFRPRRVEQCRYCPRALAHARRHGQV